VVLCGTVAPPEFEEWPERALFAGIHYLALVCDPKLLRARLSARPAWRAWDDEPRIEEMLGFNDWMRANAARTTPPMTLLETTGQTAAETTDAVTEWIRTRLDRV